MSKYRSAVTPPVPSHKPAHTDPGDPATTYNRAAMPSQISHNPQDLGGTVHFATGSSQMTPEVKADLKMLADSYKKSGMHGKLVVKGLTDSKGSKATNAALAKRRAKAVVAELAKNGIAADRLVAMGKSGEHLDTEFTNNAVNRAAQIQYMQP